MQAQSLFVWNVCVSHLAIYIGMEILPLVTSTAEVLAVFPILSVHKIICSTCVKMQIP